MIEGSWKRKQGNRIEKNVHVQWIETIVCSTASDYYVQSYDEYDEIVSYGQWGC